MTITSGSKPLVDFQAIWDLEPQPFVPPVRRIGTPQNDSSQSIPEGNRIQLMATRNPMFTSWGWLNILLFSTGERDTSLWKVVVSLKDWEEDWRFGFGMGSRVFSLCKMAKWQTFDLGISLNDKTFVWKYSQNLSGNTQNWIRSVNTKACLIFCPPT